MSYIYEMDVAHLRISYILPKGLFCFSIDTAMYNYSPYDRSELIMEYKANIQNHEKEEGFLFCKSFTAESLQAVQEKVRKWFLLNDYKQHAVEKSPEDGTDSVITA